MDKNLLEVFKNVNDWLKFAEAKNAMLIGLNGVLIFGITRFTEFEIFNFNQLFSGYFSVTIIIFTSSILCSLLSFVPRIKMVEGLYEMPSTSNLWFFEYLKTKTKEEIVKEIAAYEEGKSANQLDYDLAEQIRQNSKIASKKYSFFTVAIWLTITGIVSLPLAFIFGTYAVAGRK